MSTFPGLNPSPSVEVFYDGKAELGEGPFFEPETNQLLWVDIELCTINFLNVDSGKNRSIKLSDKVGAVIPVEGSTNLLAATGLKLCIVDRETGSVLEELASVEGERTDNRLNDAKCDRHGRLWAGTMPNLDPFGVHHQSNLYTYTQGNLTLKVPKITISNGLGWSPDNTTMYYVDSFPQHIYAFDYSITNGGISNQRVFVDYSHYSIGFPDGMCTDVEGRLWVASVGVNGCVSCWDPKSGKLLQKVTMPGAGSITSCCFGGPDHSWLFATSARFLAEDLSTQPNAGAVFVIKDLGTRGQPANRFIK